LDWPGSPARGNCSHATGARQVLKTEIKSGKFLTPPETEKKEQQEQAEKVSTKVSTRTLKDAVAGYQADRNALEKKDPKTGQREDSGLKKWVEWKPDLLIAPASFDAKLLKDFAVWRKKDAKKRGRVASGRTIDLNVTALANVLRWCVLENWLPGFPGGWQWEALGEEPNLTSPGI